MEVNLFKLLFNKYFVIFLEDLFNSKATSGSSWSMRGIGQALQFFREKPESVSLNTFLTSIMLPWHSILEGLFQFIIKIKIFF